MVITVMVNPITSYSNFVKLIFVFQKISFASPNQIEFKSIKCSTANSSVIEIFSCEHTDVYCSYGYNLKYETKNYLVFIYFSQIH